MSLKKKLKDDKQFNFSNNNNKTNDSEMGKRNSADLISTNSIADGLEDDEFLLNANINKLSSLSTSTNKQISIDEFQFELTQTLHKFRNENLFTDIFIYVEGVEFACHKVVLCAASCYFKAMFSCDLKESRLGKVYIENISPWTMKRIIDFIYTGKIEINYDNVIDIFNSAVMFQLYKLVDKCTDYIEEHIDLANCIDINLFASMHHLDKLEKETFQFILDNFMQLINSVTNNNDSQTAASTSASIANSIATPNDFVRLSDSTFSSLIKSDHLNVTREIYVYYALKKWIDYQINVNKLKNSMKIYENLFKSIRLNALSQEELEFISNNDKLVQTNENLTMYLKRYLNNGNASGVSSSNGSTADSPNENINCGLISTIENENNESIIRPSTIPRDYLCMLNSEKFQFYDFLKSKWDLLPSWPIDNKIDSKLNGFSICVNDNKLYVSGGYSHVIDALNGSFTMELTDNFHCYNPFKNTWFKCQPMLRPRAFHTSLTLASNDTKMNFIFLFYGICYNLEDTNNNSSSLNSYSSSLLLNTQYSNLAPCQFIDYYNINTNSWSNIKLNNSLISHHIFQPLNIRSLMNNNNNNNENYDPALILNHLIDFQLNQSKSILSLKNLIYILRENCIHCYEFDSKSNQLNCLPYFRLPSNLVSFNLAAAYGIKASNSMCISTYTWYSDDEDCVPNDNKASNDKLNNLTENNLDTNEDDNNENKLMKNSRNRKETVIFLLDTTKGFVYEFYPAKNKLKKLPNLNLKHSNNETSVLYIKSKIYLTGGFMETDDPNDYMSNCIEVYDENTENWSIFMNNKNNNSDLFSNNNINNKKLQIPITKNYFKLKMSLL